MMPVHQRVLVERHTYNGCSRRWKGWRAIPVGLRNSSTVGQCVISTVTICFGISSRPVSVQLAGFAMNPAS